MIRTLTLSLSRSIKTSYEVPQNLRGLSSHTSVLEKTSEEDHAAARRWLSKISIHTIPRNLCKVTFSRSSGPGGQNVNK